MAHRDGKLSRPTAIVIPIPRTVIALDTTCVYSPRVMLVDPSFCGLVAPVRRNSGAGGRNRCVASKIRLLEGTLPGVRRLNSRIISSPGVQYEHNQQARHPKSQFVAFATQAATRTPL